MAYNGKLVVLQLLKGLLGVRVADDAGGIDHAWAEEPGEELFIGSDAVGYYPTSRRSRRRLLNSYETCNTPRENNARS